MKKWIIGTICMLCMVMLVPFDTEAASYKKLYKDFLSNSIVEAGNTSIEPNWYYVLNIDKKGEKELIVTENLESHWATYYVYTIKKNKVVYLGKCTRMGSDTAQPVIVYSSKYKGIIVGGWVNGVGGAWESLYKVGNKKLKEKYYWYSYSSESGKMQYEIGTKRKKVSQKEHDSYGKKYFGSQKEYKMKKITKSNLKKSFK